MRTCELPSLLFWFFYFLWCGVWGEVCGISLHLLSAHAHFPHRDGMSRGMMCDDMACQGA